MQDSMKGRLGGLDAVLVCPKCHANIDFTEPAPIQCNCGQVIETDGGVVNFMGDVPYLLDSRDDSRFAKWIVDNIEAHAADLNILNTLSSFRDAAPSLGDALARVAKSARLDDNALKRLLYPSTFSQIQSDIRSFRGDTSDWKDADMVSYVFSKFEATSGDVVVDAGCSTGRNFLEIADHGATLVGFDLNMFALQIGALSFQRHHSCAPVKLCAADLMKMPLRDASCNYLVSFGVLALVPLHNALHEIIRVLKSGGMFVFSIECEGYLNELWDRADGSVKNRLALTRWWLGRILMENGVDWQSRPVTKRLAGMTLYAPQFVEEVLVQCGFEVTDITELRSYKGRPKLLGVSARKA